jgi:hypothetical protein
MCFLFLTQAAVRPFVVMKSIDWEVAALQGEVRGDAAHGGRELEALAGEAGPQGRPAKARSSFTTSVDGCPSQD